MPVSSMYRNLCPDPGELFLAQRQRGRYWPPYSCSHFLGQTRKPENSCESNDNLQPVYRNAVQLAHIRARSKSRLASLLFVLVQIYVSTFRFVFRLSRLTEIIIVAVFRIWEPKDESGIYTSQ
jgi:hypothetical protein